MIDKFNNYNRVDLFKKRYNEKDYIGAANIALSGWGTKDAVYLVKKKNLVLRPL